MSRPGVRVRLVVLAVEPADAVGSQPRPESVSTVFIRRGLFAAAAPRIGEQIEAASLGPHVGALFAAAPTVTRVRHRLTDMSEREPLVYAVVELAVDAVTDQLVAVFTQDGYTVQRKHGPNLPLL